MDYAATIPYGEDKEQTCSKCGAEFTVHITKQTAHNEREEYYCPECKEEYYAKASMPITVTLNKKRTDRNNGTQ